MDVNGVLLWRGVKNWLMGLYLVGVGPSVARGGRKISADTMILSVSCRNTQ